MDPDEAAQAQRKAERFWYAQFQHYALLKDQYAITLPFDIIELSSQDAVCLLERVEARWGWYVEAEQRDRKNSTQLGTLKHLPREIRDMIYLTVLDDAIKPVVDDARRNRYVYSDKEHRDRMMLTEYRFALPSCRTHFCGPADCMERDVLDLYEYVPECHSMTPIALRTASASLRTEFEYVFLFNGTFVFRCPRTFVNLFHRTNSSNRAASARQNYLKRIVLEIFDHCEGCRKDGDYEAWTGIAEVLPQSLPSLKSVKFDLGEVAHQFPYTWNYGVPRPWGGNLVSKKPTDIKK